jgi:hypothetical protein
MVYNAWVIKKCSYMSKNALFVISIRKTICFTIISLLIFSLFNISQPISVSAAGTITGTVFRDYNSNGIKETAVTVANQGNGTYTTAIDAPMPGITITAYDSTNTIVGTTTSDNITGDYTLNISAAGPYRLEMSGLPTNYFPSQVGTQSETSVRFLPDGNSANVDFAVIRAGDYCQNNPKLFSACYVQGNQITGANSGDPVLVDFNYSAGAIQPGSTLAQTVVPATHALSIPANQLGSISGIAVRKQNKDIFSSAYLKRGAGFGPGGTGQIYRTTSTGTTTAFATIPNTGVDNHINDGVDPNVFGEVFKRSLGDLDIIEDLANPANDTLFVTNLNDKQLYRLPVSTGTPTALPLPLTLPGAAQGCPTSDVYPFGLGVDENNSLYVGLVCSAQTSQLSSDLRMYVYRSSNLGASFSGPVIEAPLDYPRTVAGRNASNPAEWKPWFDTYVNSEGTGALPNDWLTENTSTDFILTKPQPALSDIDFDNGNMIISLRDRGGDMIIKNPPTGARGTGKGDTVFSSGDTLRACGNPTSGWTLESNANCGSITTLGANTGSGPGAGPNSPPGSGTTGYGEYYYRENHPSGPRHDETSFGSAIQIPGFPDVAIAAYDPFQGLGGTKGGVFWLKNSTGNITKGYQLYDTIPFPTVTFGKSGGLGDLEYVCDLAPIEIGNFVWKDVNNNGVQDPDEPKLAGVTVSLYDSSNTLLGTAVTDANGYYVFSNKSTDPNGTALTSTASNRYGITALTPNTNGYQLRLDNATDYTSPTLLQNLVLATPNATGANKNDQNDSDATAGVGALSATNAPTITFNTGISGANNHTQDFGLLLQVDSYSVGNRVWFDADQNGSINGAEAGIDNVTVNLYVDANSDGTPDSSTPAATLTTSNGGYYRFDNLSAGDYLVQIAPSNFGNGGTLQNYQVSTNPTIGNPNNNIDSDDNGINAANNAALLSNGIYSGTITLGANAEPTGETDIPGSYGSSANGTEQTDNRSNLTVDFGFYPTYSVGNRVWFDGNNNGLIDAPDGTTPGIGGVTVELLDSSNAVIATQTTDSAGFYRFDGLSAGTYSVRIPASNFLATGPLYRLDSSADVAGTSNPNTNTDSDDNGPGVAVSGNVTSGTITLGPNGTEPTGESDLATTGQNTLDSYANMTLDFGFFKPGTLGNQVWYDFNNNGIFEPALGETGIQNVVIEVFRDLNDNGIIDPAETVYETRTTNSGGGYLFADLPLTDISPDGRADYIVRVTDPNSVLTGMAATSGTPNTNNNSQNPNGYPIELSITNDINLTGDFGYFANLAIGNYIWEDTNNNALNDEPSPNGKNGVVVNLHLDSNNNGIIDPSEATAVATTTTANAPSTTNPGYYQFAGLFPGNYIVSIPSSNFTGSNPLSGLVSSTNIGTSTGDNQTNNDDNGSGNPTDTFGIISPTISLAVGQEIANSGAVPNNFDPTIDFGFVKQYALGNRVWKDLNNSGTVDGADGSTPWISGATVNLYRDTDGNGSLNGTEITTVIASTITSGTGFYLFNNLSAGNYVVEIASSNFTGTGILFNYSSSTGAGQEANPNLDIDANDNGLDTPVNGGIQSGIITLGGTTPEPTAESGGIPASGQGQPDNQANMTVDFGFVIYGRIGDQLFLDYNNNGIYEPSSGELPIEGVTVELYIDVNGDGLFDAGDTLVGTQTTNTTGNYSFNNLPLTNSTGGDAQYVVRVTDTAGRTSSFTASTGAAGQDNNSQTPTGYGITLSITNPVNQTGDFGYVPNPNLVDPPSGYKTVTPNGNVLKWKMVWINQSNVSNVLGRIEDDLSSIGQGTSYIPGTIVCEARGTTTTLTCLFDTATNKIVWTGRVGADDNNLTEDTAQNEIVITFDMIIPANSNLNIRNQARMFFDQNGDGIINAFDANTNSGGTISGNAPGNTSPTLFSRLTPQSQLAQTGYNLLPYMLIASGVLLLSFISFKKPKFGYTRTKNHRK